MKLSAPAMFAASGVGMLLIGAFVFARRDVWAFPESAAGDSAAGKSTVSAAELGAA